MNTIGLLLCSKYSELSTIYVRRVALSPEPSAFILKFSIIIASPLSKTAHYNIFYLSHQYARSAHACLLCAEKQRDAMGRLI